MGNPEKHTPQLSVTRNLNDRFAVSAKTAHGTHLLICMTLELLKLISSCPHISTA